jgi:hypothetical protein
VQGFEAEVDRKKMADLDIRKRLRISTVDAQFGR